MGKSDKSELTLAELELLLRDQVAALERWIADAQAVTSEVTRLLRALKSKSQARDKSNQ